MNYNLKINVHSLSGVTRGPGPVGLTGGRAERRGAAVLILVALHRCESGKGYASFQAMVRSITKGHRDKLHHHHIHIHHHRHRTPTVLLPLHQHHPPLRDGGWYTLGLTRLGLSTPFSPTTHWAEGTQQDRREQSSRLQSQEAQIRRRRPTPATLFRVADQGSPDDDQSTHQWVVGENGVLKPKRVNPNVYQPPSLRDGGWYTLGLTRLGLSTPFSPTTHWAEGTQQDRREQSSRLQSQEAQPSADMHPQPHILQDTLCSDFLGGHISMEE
ncbi:hypothetical protein CRUP_004048 [Coryphaenoides rupestris]|nr:hypothetical protein CRUP_004048 [Coryphaenoides rupestris]